MFSPSSIKGVIPPIATPLTGSEEVDSQGMAKLVNHLIAAEVDGIFVLGNSGEAPYLTQPDRAEAVEAAVEAAAGRVPVIAGVSDASTKKALEHCRAAVKAGADFVIATPPYYFDIKQEWIYEHMRAIGEEAGGRLLLYNVPQVISGIEPETVARLARSGLVVGIKDSADLTHLQQVVFETRGTNFRVLVGSEYCITAGLLLGAHGCTPSPASMHPRLYVELYRKTIQGEVPAALALQESANRFVDGLAFIPSWFSAVKMALFLMDICGPTAARPSPPVTPEETELLRQYLERWDLL
jgi:4-hydroxy-tetrahydrodipicolinate synthase